MTLYLHGLGHFHPENEITNRFLEELDIGTDEEWILDRVGIRSRRTVAAAATSVVVVFVLDDELVHALGLEIETQFDVFSGPLLEIGGVVGGRKRVFTAAVAGQNLGKFPGLALFCALEHQVFEEMCDPGFARAFIRRSDAVPNHVGDHRHPVVANDDHPHAVGKRKGLGVEHPGPGGGV